MLHPKALEVRNLAAVQLDRNVHDQCALRAFERFHLSLIHIFFAGQVVAALVAGNTVAAKPAEQTPVVARRFVALLHEVGVPADALQCLHGTGETVGAALVAHPFTAGVCFTGSTAVARLINRTLAAKDGPIVPLIAETGGLNAMVVDSTALHEQVVDAVVQSAFRSAGQRCSALRLLCVHESIADGLIEMLQGAMAELSVGDPAQLATDVGPLIDDEAFAGVAAQVDVYKRQDQQPGTQPGRVEPRFVAEDEAFTLQALDPFQHRGRRQVHGLGELEIADASVGLQHAQDAAIGLVQRAIFAAGAGLEGVHDEGLSAQGLVYRIQFGRITPKLRSCLLYTSRCV